MDYLQPLRALFRPFRSQEAAKAAVGQTVDLKGKQWRCVGHNDLGCLYWRRVRNDREFGKTYVVPAADEALEWVAWAPASAWPAKREKNRNYLKHREAGKLG